MSRASRRPPDDPVKLAPFAVGIVTDGDDLIGELCRLRDLDAIKWMVAGVMVDPPFSGRQTMPASSTPREKSWSPSQSALQRQWSTSLPDYR